jgi:hypothetical protein
LLLCHLESTIETLFRIISELLRSVSTLIVPACIDALVTLVRLNNYPHLLNIQDAVAGQVWALSYLESDYTIRMSALSHRMALLVHQVPSASAVLSNLVNFGFKEDVEIELRQAIVEFVRAIFSFDSSLDLSFDENAIFTAMNILGHALIDIDNRDEELFTILSLRTLSLLLVHPIAQVSFFIHSYSCTFTSLIYLYRYHFIESDSNERKNTEKFEDDC